MHSAALAVNFSDCAAGMEPPGPCSVCHLFSPHTALATGSRCFWCGFELLCVGMRVELPALPAPGRSWSCSASHFLGVMQPGTTALDVGSTFVGRFAVGCECGCAAPPSAPCCFPQSETPPHGRARCSQPTSPSLHWWKSKAPPPSPRCSSPKQLNLSPSSQFPIHTGAAGHLRRPIMLPGSLAGNSQRSEAAEHGIRR